MSQRILSTFMCSRPNGAAVEVWELEHSVDYSSVAFAAPNTCVTIFRMAN
jgi:hypothetical protein